MSETKERELRACDYIERLVNTELSKTAATPPTERFECSWCVIAEVDAQREADEFGGWDADTGLPICDDCAAQADEEAWYEARNTPPTRESEGRTSDEGENHERTN